MKKHVQQQRVMGAPRSCVSNDEEAGRGGQLARVEWGGGGEGAGRRTWQQLQLLQVLPPGHVMDVWGRGCFCGCLGRRPMHLVRAAAHTQAHVLQ
jgi:hypothetical protein